MYIFFHLIDKPIIQRNRVAKIVKMLNKNNFKILYAVPGKD